MARHSIYLIPIFFIAGFVLCPRRRPSKRSLTRPLDSGILPYRSTSASTICLAPWSLEEKVGQMRDHAPAIRRLGVPKYDWWNEGLHGVAFAGTATNFPQVIGMARWPSLSAT